jgi:hypothetical protein
MRRRKSPLFFANAFVSPGVNSRAELVPSRRAYARNGAPRRWLADKQVARRYGFMLREDMDLRYGFIRLREDMDLCSRVKNNISLIRCAHS